MKWEVFIPASQPGQLNRTATVQASNWLEALSAGLNELGQAGPVMSNLALDIKDHAVHVTDMRGGRVFEVRPLPSGRPSEPPPPPLDPSSLDLLLAPPPPYPSQLVRHEVFFRRDEDPGKANRLTYRERLISVPPETAPPRAEEVLRHYYTTIRAQIEDRGPGKFINLAAFDHAFRERAERPPIAALNWKDWRGAEPEVTFPMSAPAVVETSYIPAADEEAEAASRRRVASRELNIGRLPVSIDLNEALAEVFEEMQGLYAIATMDEAIAFALDLAVSRIPCQAAVGLAKLPATDMLLYVALQGDGVDRLVGQRVPIARTLAGFALIQGYTVAISDAQNDPRVLAEMDRIVGSKTRSLLCAPIVHEGRTFGVLELVNRHGDDSWREGEVNIISYVASHLGEYIAQSLPDPGGDLEA